MTLYKRTLAALLVACAVLLPAAPAAADAQAVTRLPGTAWWTDPATGQTVAAVDDSVPSAVAERIARTGVRVVREPGRLREHIAGGDPFHGGATGRCLVGFNARRLPQYYFMTSAHCVGGVGTAVYASSTATTPIGVVSVVDPSYDYALVRYTAAVPHPSAVNLFSAGLQPITAFGSGYVGQAVRRTGPSGVRSGTITALNVTVNYAGGTVHGLIRTNICTQPGDSGGPLFAGSTAIGITSGGSGSCTAGSASYYASARRVATTHGLSTY